MTFKDFINESTQTKDVSETLKKVPSHHRKLVKGYKYVFQNTTTMKGDSGHIGLIDDSKKQITLASPWLYGRQFVLLHELAHLVWKYYVKESQKQEWSQIVKGTKNKAKDTDEELFAMAYASNYTDNKVVIHDHPSWERFVKKISKQV